MVSRRRSAAPLFSTVCSSALLLLALCALLTGTAVIAAFPDNSAGTVRFLCAGDQVSPRPLPVARVSADASAWAWCPSLALGMALFSLQPIVPPRAAPFAPLLAHHSPRSHQQLEEWRLTFSNAPWRGSSITAGSSNRGSGGVSFDDGRKSSANNVSRKSRVARARQGETLIKLTRCPGAQQPSAGETVYSQTRGVNVVFGCREW